MCSCMSLLREWLTGCVGGCAGPSCYQCVWFTIGSWLKASKSFVFVWLKDTNVCDGVILRARSRQFLRSGAASIVPLHHLAGLARMRSIGMQSGPASKAALLELSEIHVKMMLLRLVRGICFVPWWHRHANANATTSAAEPWCWLVWKNDLAASSSNQ